MNRSAMSAVAVVIVIALVVGAVVALVAIGTDGATAVEVGNQTVSRESVNDEMRAFADNGALVKAAAPNSLTASPGTLTADAANALVMTGVVQELVIHEYLDAKGEKITSADRAAAQELLPDTTVGQFRTGFPAWYRTRYVERLAAYTALARVLGVDLADQSVGDTIDPLLARTAKRAGVTVDPRYGRFVAKNARVRPYVLPPGLLAGTESSG